MMGSETLTNRKKGKRRKKPKIKMEDESDIYEDSDWWLYAMIVPVCEPLNKYAIEFKMG